TEKKGAPEPEGRRARIRRNRLVHAIAGAEGRACRQGDGRHNDRARSGWNARETALAPANVAGGPCGALWSSPEIESFGATRVRLWCGPLYLHGVQLTEGGRRAEMLAVAYVTAAGAMPTPPRPRRRAWCPQERPCGSLRRRATRR